MLSFWKRLVTIRTASFVVDVKMRNERRVHNNNKKPIYTLRLNIEVVLIMYMTCHIAQK